MENLTIEQIAYLLQFAHLEKTHGFLPGANDANISAIFGIDVNKYSNIKNQFTENALKAAQDLLTDPAFAKHVDKLPFAAGATVVGLGDSITDDYQSWLEILRHLLKLRRPYDKIKIINAGISGETTAQIVGRFPLILQNNPDWIICLIGTNDSRTNGLDPNKTVVSLSETRQNLAVLHNYVVKNTKAKFVWMTPPPLIPEKIANDWWLGSFQLAWSNENITAVANAVLKQPDPVIDLQTIFGLPPNPDLLLSDGIHPSLRGQKAIVKALITKISQ